MIEETVSRLSPLLDAGRIYTIADRSQTEILRGFLPAEVAEEAGDLGVPHQGVIFMEEVCRGHPMMPFPVGFEADQSNG